MRAAALAAALAVLAAVPASAGERVPIAAAVHVHTTVSTGTEDLDGIAQRARAAGLDAVLFSENYRLAFEYGIRPFAGLLRWRERFPSLGPDTTAAYLEAVRRAGARHPDVILVPGFELVPYYYWTGSLLDGTLTMHDGQRNLLLFGVQQPEALAALPLVTGPRPQHAAERALRFAPALLMGVAGTWLLRLRRVRHVRWRQYRVEQTLRYRWAGAAVLALAFLLGLNAALAGTPPWDPRDGPRGYAPHQAVIAAAAARGMLPVWSMPEARDFSQHRRAGFTVTIRTNPYPEALAETQGYAAFGAVYADTTTVEAPGGRWDQLLLDYVAGRRAAWPVALGESAYHSADQAGKTLDEVQTVFLADGRTPAALLEALRAGRAYARRRVPGFALVLARFAADGAGPGETAASAAAPRLGAVITASDGGAHPVEARLIRNGAVIAERRGTTPFAFDLTDREAPAAGAWYYRLEVRGEAGSRLLTNPVFLRRKG